MAYRPVFASSRAGMSVGGRGNDPIGAVDPRPGAPTLPGSSGAPFGERANPLAGLLGFVQANWVPFTSRMLSRFIAPRPPAQPWESPYDVSAGEAVTRFGDFPSSDRPFPYPWMTGTVGGFMPMLDQYSRAFAWAKTPSGPGVLTPVPIPWDAQYPNNPKVSG